MHYRRLIALLMVCAYLILPLDSFANLAPRLSHPLQGGSSLQDENSLTPGGDQRDSSLEKIASRENVTFLQDCSATGESNSHCPCSDRHGSDGCNPGCSCCSCCSFCAPLPAGVPLRIARPTTSFSVLGPLNYFPKVYLPIFVPPQNRA
jgi:hypothetical protein